MLVSGLSKISRAINMDSGEDQEGHGGHDHACIAGEQTGQQNQQDHHRK
jgi:hypothetical protein